MRNIEILFLLWDRDQLIVILLHTRVIKNTNFVGPKNETIRGMKILLTQRTQWCYYIKEESNMKNAKPNNNPESLDSLIQSSFPFLICDLALDLFQPKMSCSLSFSGM